MIVNEGCEDRGGDKKNEVATIEASFRVENHRRLHSEEAEES
jgi:hypothetical protein